MSLSPVEQNAYEDYMHDLASYERDYLVNLRISREEGREEGLAQGREQGREEALKDMVANMISLGMPDESIAAVTKLPMEVIASMRKS